MQINRSDVFANDSCSNSFNEGHLDYGYACAFVDIDFAGFAADVFTEKTKQYLRLYTASCGIEGEGAGSSFFACKGLDAFVFSCSDTRHSTGETAVRLKMLRPAEVRTKSHLAISAFLIKEDAVILKQEFTEDNYYCASAVAVGVKGKKFRIRQNNESGGLHPGIEGRKPIVIGMETETETRICLEPGPGNFDVFISSASSFDPAADVAEESLEILRQAEETGPVQLKAKTESFWEDLWERSYIELWGNENARLVEQHYHYFMYILACCSEGGSYPPNYGGLLFSTRGDFRHWGTMQWWNNLQSYYSSVMASGRYELIMPFFKQWNSRIGNFSDAARQQWGAEGIYIPETVSFNGPELLPGDIAEELRDLMLCRKTRKEFSERFWRFAFRKHPFESRWNFKGPEKWVQGELIYSDWGTDYVFGPVTHMFGGQAGIAYLYWDYYQYSGDQDYLAQYGYPIIRGVAEFFRTFPNLKKDENGVYHMYLTNNGEGSLGCMDSMENISAMYGIVPVAIKAAEILGVDQELRGIWQELLSCLAPMPASNEGEGPVFVCYSQGLRSEANQKQSLRPLPCRMFNLCTMETEKASPGLYATGKRTVEAGLALNAINSRAYVYEMSGMGVIMAHMGKAKEMAEIIVGQINCINAAIEYEHYKNNGSIPQFENRLTGREGVNAISAQRLGNISTAIQRALLQSGGGTPEGEPVIRLFAALPEEWNSRFKLYAAGGFVVEASRENGKPGKAAITSSLGKKLAVRNVWGVCNVSHNEKPVGVFTEDLIELETSPGDIVVFSPSFSPSERLR
jgi:hypothetical protein